MNSNYKPIVISPINEGEGLSDQEVASFFNSRRRELNTSDRNILSETGLAAVNPRCDWGTGFDLSPSLVFEEENLEDEGDYTPPAGGVLTDIFPVLEAFLPQELEINGEEDREGDVDIDIAFPWYDGEAPEGLSIDAFHLISGGERIEVLRLDPEDGFGTEYWLIELERIPLRFELVYTSCRGTRHEFTRHKSGWVYEIVPA